MKSFTYILEKETGHTNVSVTCSFTFPCACSRVIFTWRHDSHAINVSYLDFVTKIFSQRFSHNCSNQSNQFNIIKKRRRNSEVINGRHNGCIDDGISRVSSTVLFQVRNQILHNSALPSLPGKTGNVVTMTVAGYWVCVVVNEAHRWPSSCIRLALGFPIISS